MTIRLIDNPALYTAHRWRQVAGRLWIIVHDPGNDRASPEATVRYLRYNKDRDSYCELAWAEPGGLASHQLCRLDEVTGHAGRFTQIPGTNVRNGYVNEMTWGVSVCTYGRPLPADAFNGLAELIALRIKQFKMPDAGVVLAHREISTVKGRRSDPRGVDMNSLRAAVAQQLNRRG